MSLYDHSLEKHVGFEQYSQEKRKAANPANFVEGETYPLRLTLPDWPSGSRHAVDIPVNLSSVKERTGLITRRLRYKVAFSPVDDRGNIRPDVYKRTLKPDGIVLLRTILPFVRSEGGYFVGIDPPSGDTESTSPVPVDARPLVAA